VAHVKLWRMSVILLLGLGLGLAWNGLSGRGLSLSANAMIRDGDEVIEALEASKRLERGALFLDARPREFFSMSHIPGALPLPEDDFEAAFEAIEARLRAQEDLVVYCSGFGCEASHLVAQRLRERGLQAAILHEGLPAWEEAGLPVEEGP
jgi:rhodanese-related sulfurtransferase